MKILYFFLASCMAYEYSLILVKKQESSKLICFFVHGHRGHYLQVTPLLPALSSCDVYSFDFREDISGLSDRVIQKQSLFIETSLKTFEKDSKNIVLICHSMGGISGILAAGSVYSQIFKIITLNTPLGQSPVNTHLMFPYFYSKIHQIFNEKAFVVVSITGADDSTVPPALTNADEIRTHHFYTSTLVRKTLGHNEILDFPGIRDKIKELVENQRVFKEEFLFEEIKIWEDDECWVHNQRMVGFGSFESQTKKWFGLTIQEDQEILVKVQGNLLKTCRGDRKLLFRPLIMGNSNYFRLSTLKNDKFFFLLDSGKLEIHKISEFKCLRIYYKYCVFYSKHPALIKVGNALRTPLFIESSEETSWIYSRCGKEEFLIESSEETLIKFHEECKKNLEILIFAKNFNFRVSTPLVEILSEFFKDFRLEIFAFAFAFLFENQAKVAPAVFIYWLLGKYFRCYGLFMLDHVDYYDKRVTIPETILLTLVSYIISLFFQRIMAFMQRFQMKTVERRLKKEVWALIILSAAFPWVIIPIFLVRYPRIYSDFDKKLLFVQILLTIPQQISFFYIPINYFSFSFGTISDLLSVIPIITTILIPSVQHKESACIMSWLFILIVQDLLYRGQILLLLVSFYQVFQYIVKKNSKI